MRAQTNSLLLPIDWNKVTSLPTVNTPVINRTKSNLSANDGKRPIRTLLIAEGANPALTSASLVGWSCVQALGKVTNAHIVTEMRNEADFIKAGMTSKDFTAINARRSQGFFWKIGDILRGGKDLGWTTHAAMAILAYPFFERALWKQFRTQLEAGEFDLVHRILPLSPMTPSWLSKKLAKIGVPFIVGPLNGGVPWPKDFAYMQAKEKEWVGKFRNLAKWLPGAGDTREYATAIIAASRTTWREINPSHHSKTVFIPENAIETSKFAPIEKPSPTAPLKVAFVGRLVPLKGVDMIIEAAAPLAREGKLILDIIGDGPERASLQELVTKENVGPQIKLEGWVSHAELGDRLRQSDVFAFPSVREFGGGAVLEAMALGLVPIVLDHGGPVELVPTQTGFTLPMTSRENIVKMMRDLFTKLASDPIPLGQMGRNAQSHIRHYYTWEAKADQMLEVYKWVLGQREDKPSWGMPFEFKSEESVASSLTS